MALQQGAAIFQFVPSIRLDILYKNLLVALEVSGVGEIVDSKQEQGLLQAVELASMVAGMDAEVDPSHDHAAHIQVIQMFLNSPGIENVFASNPEGVEAVTTHMEEHLQFQQQAEQLGKQGASNPYDQGFSQQSPANQARQDTAVDRENIALVGAGGQG
jgi:antitoxin component HigA of HigAB toxin-antitoxin module